MTKTIFPILICIVENELYKIMRKIHNNNNICMRIKGTFLNSLSANLGS